MSQCVLSEWRRADRVFNASYEKAKFLHRLPRQKYMDEWIHCVSGFLPPLPLFNKYGKELKFCCPPLLCQSILQFVRNKNACFQFSVIHFVYTWYMPQIANTTTCRTLTEQTEHTTHIRGKWWKYEE